MITIVRIFVCPEKGQPMKPVCKAYCMQGFGIEGDRYSRGEGSWNKGNPGKRQVTLINSVAFLGSRYTFAESRRNIVTEGGELMPLIGQMFRIGEAIMQGVKYCTPCDRPNKLSGKEEFAEHFSERGGLIAEVMRTGFISVKDTLEILTEKEMFT